MAITLLFVGMITVFIILFLVVVSGNLLIILVNKYIPEKPKMAVPKSALHGNKLSAVVAAVEIVTKGRGHITKISKEDS